MNSDINELFSKYGIERHTLKKPEEIFDSINPLS